MQNKLLSLAAAIGLLAFVVFLCAGLADEMDREAISEDEWGAEIASWPKK